MNTIFIEYPSCSTCRKAKKFLQTNDIAFQDRHIVEETPSFEELKGWCETANVSVNSLFNTSGQVYRSMELKNKLASMSDDEKYALLAQHGMLIKRPLLVQGNTLLVGFKEAQWQTYFQK